MIIGKKSMTNHVYMNASFKQWYLNLLVKKKQIKKIRRRTYTYKIYNNIKINKFVIRALTLCRQNFLFSVQPPKFSRVMVASLQLNIEAILPST